MIGITQQIQLANLLNELMLVTKRILGLTVTKFRVLGHLKYVLPREISGANG